MNQFFQVKITYKRFKLQLKFILHKFQTMNSRRNGNDDFMARLGDLFQKKKRLHTLMMLHSLGSFFIGLIGFLFPGTFGWFFLDASSSSLDGVACVMVRLYCALVFAQGWIIMNLTDCTPTVKKTVIQSYFGCFLASVVALTVAHAYNDGTMAGGFFGMVKFSAFLGLTAGYGWFALFQPPEVFNVLGNSL